VVADDRRVEEPSRPDIIVRRKYRAALRISSWARSATKHRISRERASHVIEHCGLYFKVDDPGGRDPRLFFFGDDPAGVGLEVIAIEASEGGLKVIHAMAVRQRHRDRYERAMKWQM
jgi:hypothetical protein